jgi:hypothetical protein
MAQIKKHFDSLTAVLILANGTESRVTVGTNCALSILSAIFPNIVPNNVAFLFTNVSSPIYFNFPQHTLPGFLKDAPHFLLDNPIALQKKYLKMKDGPNMKMRRTDLHGAVKAIEQNALETLVDFFDRLDSLEPLSTASIVPLYKEPQYIAEILALMVAALAATAKAFTVSFHPTCSWGSSLCSSSDVNADFQKSIHAPASKQRPASNHDYLCTALDCYSTCSPQPPLVSVWVANMLPWLQLGPRPNSIHPYPRHCHTRNQRDLGSTRSNTEEKSSQFLEDPAHPAHPVPSLGPSIRVEEADRPRKQGNTDTGVGKYQLERMRGVLEQGLDLLRKAKAKVQKGMQNVKRIFSLHISK